MEHSEAECNYEHVIAIWQMLHLRITNVAIEKSSYFPVLEITTDLVANALAIIQDILYHAYYNY